MILRRTNGNSPATRSEDYFAASERHHARGQSNPASSKKPTTAPEEVNARDPANGDAGDIIFGARAIARYLFADDGNRARRRVFNLWSHYSARQERAGFFKLKGALCLSKTQWRAFHGL